MSEEHTASEESFVINKILEKELEKVGCKNATLGEFDNSELLSNIDDVFAGNSGASFAIRKLKIDKVQDKISLQKNLKESMTLIFQALSSIGIIIDASKYTDYPVLSACCGSGYANMNPAIICVEFLQTDDNKTDLYISAYAKEGLIKQKTAKKAILKLKNFLDF